MHIIARKKGYEQDPTRYLELHRFKDLMDNLYLIEGGFGKQYGWKEYGFSKKEVQDIIKKGVIRLEFEEPNKFCLGDRSTYDKDFKKIFTICPYTADWLNTKYQKQKRVPIFFPFNEKYIPKKQIKKYDIIYMGHIAQQWLYEELDILQNYRYALVSNTKDPRVTHHQASYEEKMRAIAQSKITLVHNTIHLRKEHVLMLWTIPDFEKNKAFSLIPRRFEWSKLFSKDFIVPQIKSRTFEAAFGRSLILCRKDQFNIIERFFVPNKEFIYYEEGQLKTAIDQILRNYSEYEEVIEAAYQKAKQLFTTKALIQTINVTL